MIYLATPYSHKDPKIVEARFIMACKLAGRLMQRGYVVFSPIAHAHPIALHCPKMPQMDYEYWLKFDEEFIRRCDTLMIAKMSGWKTSKGIAAEVKLAKKYSKPIKEIDPKELLKWNDDPF